MAKKTKKRKGTKKRKSARSVARKVVYQIAGPRKRKSTKRKSRKASKPRRRIGAANSRKPMKGLVKKAMNGALTGGAAYGTKRLAAMLPATVNPWLRDLGIFTVGTLISTKAEAVGMGMAGKGVENILDRVIPGVAGVGRRNTRGLSEEEIRAIEQAAVKSQRRGIDPGNPGRTVVGGPSRVLNGVGRGMGTRDM